MNTKLLILSTWIFYLLGKDSPDQVWFFCMCLGAGSAVCCFFYNMAHRRSAPAKKQA